MTLDAALAISQTYCTANKLTFAPAAFIKQKGKLPIFAYTNTAITYVLKSQVGEGGFDSDRFTAKWKLKRRDDWEPRLKENDLL